MRKSIAIASAIVVAAFAAAVGGLAVAADDLAHPLWAYAVPEALKNIAPDAPVTPAERDPPDTKYNLPGKPPMYTRAQIGNGGPGGGPMDWYPEDHPAEPAIVAHGDRARGINSCATCHFANGRGLPENSPVSGQSKDYLVATLHDMKNGLRKSGEPRKRNAAAMLKFAQAMTDEDIDQASAYFASVPYGPWITVKESATAPKTSNAFGLLIPLEGDKAGTRPLAKDEIVEVPADPFRSETLRDWRSPMVAYVPIGSLAKGKALVTTGGGKTTACTACHGADLQGMGKTPAIASRSPGYIGRQLGDYRSGARSGPNAALMGPVAKTLSDDDMTNIAAYLASIPVSEPPKRVASRD